MPQSKAPATQVVKVSEYKFDATVRDCMVWPDPRAKKRKGRKTSAAAAAEPVMVRPTKGALGKPTLRHFNAPPPLAPAADDGLHVAAALRGWPNAQAATQSSEEVDIFAPTPTEEAAKKRKKKKKPKKPVIIINSDGEEEEVKDYRRQKALEDQEPDPEMGELMAHKFLTEAARERTEARERELYEAQMKVRRANDQRYPRDIKATKTTQLRAIALAPKVEQSPLDLWQMSKFKSHAKPKTQSIRNTKSNTRNEAATSGAAANKKSLGDTNADFPTSYSDALRVDSGSGYVIYDGERAVDADVGGAEMVGEQQEGDGVQAVVPAALAAEQ